MEERNSKLVPAKRVDNVSLRIAMEISLLYQDCTERSPADGYKLFKQFLGELDPEYFDGDVFGCEKPTNSNHCVSYQIKTSILMQN